MTPRRRRPRGGRPRRSLGLRRRHRRRPADLLPIGDAVGDDGWGVTTMPPRWSVPAGRASRCGWPAARSCRSPSSGRRMTLTVVSMPADRARASTCRRRAIGSTTPSSCSGTTTADVTDRSSCATSTSPRRPRARRRRPPHRPVHRASPMPVTMLPVSTMPTGRRRRRRRRCATHDGTRRRRRPPRPDDDHDQHARRTTDARPADDDQPDRRRRLRRHRRPRPTRRRACSTVGRVRSSGAAARHRRTTVTTASPARDGGTTTMPRQRQLLTPLGRDHRPPPRLGALDVRLLVGHRRRPARAAFSRSLATSHGSRV